MEPCRFLSGRPLRKNTTRSGIGENRLRSSTGDAEVDRWGAISPNVPLLITEGDSIEEIERELPDVLELITDTERIHGPAVIPGNRKQGER